MAARCHVLFSLLWFLPFLSYVSGCGITTHIVISEKAKEHFGNISPTKVDYKQIITKHHDAFMAGSPYPDAFYSSFCDKGYYHNVSEDTHWSGFLNATINYIRKNYPQPWDTATEKLVAFMFGFVSHQVADIVWHSLGVDQGFITTMGMENFHGSYTNAHTAADFGGDVMNLFDMDVALFMDPLKEWYVPVDDLTRIYQDFYGTTRITSPVIDNCSTLLLVAGYAELAGGSDAYAAVANTSPFLVDQYRDYFLGGVNDMAGWSARLWNRTITMLENGTSSCLMPHNPLYINCTQPSTQEYSQLFNTKERNGYFRQPDLRGLTTDDLIVKKAYRGILIKPGHKIRSLIEKKRNTLLTKRKRIIEEKRKLQKRKEPEQLADSPNMLGIYYAPDRFSKFGWSLAVGDLNGDHNDDLVVGAPGYGGGGSPDQGRVYILYGSDDGLPVAQGAFYLLNMNNHTNCTLKGPAEAQSLFGTSVAVVDVNLDGIPDVVVGAPAFRNHGQLDYNGAVFIYYGKLRSNAAFYQPNITITCQSQYCNLGFTMTTGDINKDGHDDLLLGTPYYQMVANQSGIVSALPSSKAYSDHMVITFESLISKWNLQNKQAYSWFGHNIRVRSGLVLVGQPYFRKCSRPDCQLTSSDLQTVGALNLYNLGVTYNISGLTLHGEQQFDLAGYSSDIGFPYDNKSLILAVGVVGRDAPGTYLTVPITIHQAGAVFVYNITNNNVQLLATFQGDRQFGRFGIYVKFEDVNADGIDDLMIGAPRRNYDATDIVPRWFSEDYDGKLYVYYGGKYFPRGNATSTPKCDLFYPCPQTMANFTAEADGYKVKMGYNAAILKAKNLNNMITPVLYGDEHFDEKSSSTLYVYRINTTATSDEEEVGG
ncbi:phosphatidylinositol-glycan-specific phospholipase D-like isoform X2 [Mizuhopecten yessoensis]|uniref:phosphatidylinositol-glycan-specific phospholipase D-like isoform X2 n=1 Tax=Mizuhopecten yessoensis TaxID=6573 RepID=UPI000B45882A|nr:phosphatidylinositol-glycan-specific phospholipase D-like isoform X2 [Mizuhopecten yessoensis]